MSTIDTIYRNMRLTTHNGPEGLAEFALKMTSKTASFFQRLDHSLARRRTRRQLLELTDIELLDVGITRQQALHEADRPFWI